MSGSTIKRITTNDGSHTLHSDRYGETYHSTFGAVTEAQHVFIEATGVKERIQLGKPTRILEIGFGLGLNALLSLDLACQHKCAVQYHTYENALVCAQTIEALNYQSLVKTPDLHNVLVETVSRAHRSLASYVAETTLSEMTINDYASLHLHVADATAQPLQVRHEEGFHAIYLDAFSPDTNAECWSPEFIANLASVLTNEGLMSTYSAKGDVRRAMLAAGLHVEKRPGPPGKREFLIAGK